MMISILDYFLHLLYPPKCMFCGDLLSNEDARYCDACFYDLKDYDCAERTVPGFDQSIATFFYEGPVRNGILRFKFRGMRCYGAVFARWLSGTVQDKLRQPCDLVSWVPCSKRRRWVRGYDQAEVLAKALADELGLQCIPVLKKKKHNRAQSSMTNAESRKANALGVYEPFAPQLWAGKRILLVDDILTTGATLSECARVLKGCGVGGLACAVIAAVEN